MKNKEIDKNILLIGSSGYLGSFLVENLSISNLQTSDLLPSSHTKVVKDAYTFEEEYLNQFDGVILLAGMSRVADCKSNPEKCFELNTKLPLYLRKKLKADKFFIYASSGSVYNGSGKFPATENFNIRSSSNAYDHSKLQLDLEMYKQKKPFISLRFGTVNGFTKNWRNELVVNKMCQDAYKSNLLSLSNAFSWRAILDIQELVNAFSILLQRIKFSQEIYNLSSFNCQIQDIATNVQKITNCKIDKGLDSAQSYSFSMDSNLFCKDFNYEFRCSLDLLIKKILKDITTNDK
jgi:nucleoside-diphosphate-sugar epimerase